MKGQWVKMMGENGLGGGEKKLGREGLKIKLGWAGARP
jgi:hypothetical protein